MNRKIIDRRKLNSLTRAFENAFSKAEQIFQLEKDWSENPRCETARDAKRR